VWSLTGEHAETVSRAPKVVAQTVAPPPAEEEPSQFVNTEVTPPAPEGPQQPSKKGWWQRTFRSDS
jgi:hypothetical protein